MKRSKEKLEMKIKIWFQSQALSRLEIRLRRRRLTVR